MIVIGSTRFLVNSQFPRIRSFGNGTKQAVNHFDTVCFASAVWHEQPMDGDTTRNELVSDPITPSKGKGLDKPIAPPSSLLQ